MDLASLTAEELQTELSKTRCENARLHAELATLRGRAEIADAGEGHDPRFRRLFEHAKDICFIASRDGLIEDISPSVRAVTGMTRESLLGTPLRSLFVAKDRCDALFTAVRDMGEAGDLDAIICAPGSRRHVHVTVTAGGITGEDGEITAITGTMHDITERWRADMALRRSEENYRNLFDHAGDAILIIDPDAGIILEANLRACTMYGVPYASMVGSPMKDLCAGHADAEASSAIDLRGMQYRTFEAAHVNARGETIEVRVTASLIEFNGNIALLSINRDITEVKTVERSLREHQDYLTNLLNSVADPLVVKNSDHQWTMVNDAYCALFDMKRELVIGKTDFDQFPDDEARLSWNNDERVLKSGDDSVSEQRLSNKDGEIRRLITKTMAYTNLQGERFIVSIGRDITELKRVQEDLEKLNVKLEMRVYERTGELMATIDKLEDEIEQRKRIERIRSATYKISELAHSVRGTQDLYHAIHAIIIELMPARNFTIALFHPDSSMLSFPYFVDEHEAPPIPRKAGRGLIEYVLRIGKPLLTTSELIDDLQTAREIEPPGPFPANWLGVPLKTRNKTIGVLAIQSRESEIRYGETEMNILTFVSEQIAMTIERKRTEEELVGAKAAAERASRLKTTLLMNLSHEFRTPMNSILGFSDILKSELQEPIQKEMAQTVHYSGFRLMRTLNAIVDLAQIESGTVQLDTVDLDITGRVQNVMQSFRTAAAEKNLQLHLSVNQNLRMSIDPRVFDQIVGNLVENAIKFTTYGSITVLVDQEFDDAGHWVIIKVQDTGIGIAPENLELIFHEFRQLSEGFKRTHEGNGLGLTLCRKWVELLEGTISVRSQEGRGSEFTVRLPCELYVKDNVISDFEEAVKPLVERAKARIMRTGNVSDVLVVEDNDYNLELMKHYLRSAFHVEFAGDGERAIMMALHKQYALILMDINLGLGIDGLEATRQIRSIPGYEHVPIVAVTGYTADFNSEKLLAGGCSHYLAKPFEKYDLLTLIDKIMSEQDRPLSASVRESSTPLR